MSDLAAIVLAAGQSRRLGQPKQLVELEGEPLLRRAVRLAMDAGCSPVVVVLGACDQPCREVLAGLSPAQLCIVINPDWAEGMSTSLRAGVHALEVSPGASPTDQSASVLIMVCDQVHITSTSLQRLLTAHTESHTPVTAARYAGRLGVPAIFRAELLPALATLTGDQGARRLLEQWAANATAVDMPEAAAELDTPEDLARLQ